MFRKKHDVAERSRSQLKSSAAKRIKTDILGALPYLTREVLDEVMPTKDGIELVKLANRALVYVHVPSKTPYFFDADGRGNLFPTVYALWATRRKDRESGMGGCCPSLLVHAPVSKFVLNGADIMLPGVVVRDPSAVDYIMGERRGVVSNGNPMPYAVGEMLRDKEGVITWGMTGKGLKARTSQYVMHCYLDFLWQMGPKTLPNDGFRVDGVSALATLDCEIPGEEQRKMGCWEELADGDGGGGGNCSAKQSAGTEAGRDLGLDLSEVTLEGGMMDGEVEEVEEGPSMDDLLVSSFLNAVKRDLKDKQLPMLVSTFYSSVLLPSRPPGRSIDIKRTRFKKLSAFLKEMQNIGIENKGVQSLVGVNRAHPDLKAFQATSETAGAAEAVEAAEVETGAGTVLGPGAARGGD
ncbi:unnamed protein product, partial [Choristocarpus tenellus]